MIIFRRSTSRAHDAFEDEDSGALVRPSPSLWPTHNTRTPTPLTAAPHTDLGCSTTCATRLGSLQLAGACGASPDVIQQPSPTQQAARGGVLEVADVGISREACASAQHAARSTEMRVDMLPTIVCGQGMNARAQTCRSQSLQPPRETLTRAARKPLHQHPCACTCSRTGINQCAHHARGDGQCVGGRAVHWASVRAQCYEIGRARRACWRQI